MFPVKNIWAEAKPQAQETPSGAVQEGNSIPVSVDMCRKFLRVFVRYKKGAFLQGFCCNLLWTCDSSCHLSWFLKVDSAVWICQNNSQAKGGLKLAPETFAVCTMKMDGWDTTTFLCFLLGWCNLARVELFVSGCYIFWGWNSFPHKIPSKSKMIRFFADSRGPEKWKKLLPQVRLH